MYHPTSFLLPCLIKQTNPLARIVPFRGEYFELKPEKRYVVKNLVYQVPNPAFPFLVVHFTRMTDGSIHCGPNAVLAFKREGYTWNDVSLTDTCDTLSYGGFWKLASKNFGEGLEEIYRSFSKKAFTRSLQRLIPGVREDDLMHSHAGVRAQALMPDGKLVDDFLIVRGERSLQYATPLPPRRPRQSRSAGRLQSNSRNNEYRRINADRGEKTGSSPAGIGRFNEMAYS
jgi:L-2-hydroxyglutarate oxidase